MEESVAAVLGPRPVLGEVEAARQGTEIEGIVTRDLTAGNTAGLVGENSAAMAAEVTTEGTRFETAAAAAAGGGVAEEEEQLQHGKVPMDQGTMLGVFAGRNTAGCLEGTGHEVVVVVVVEQQDADIAETLHCCC